MFVPSAAAAQLAGSIGIDSDYRLRGYSLSDDRPAASAQVSYDDRSGLYFNLSGLTELAHGGRFLGVVGNAGYAKRVSERVTLDAGVLRSQLRAGRPYEIGYKYTEVYAGAFVGPVAARIHYSPDYRRPGLSTLYGELETGFEPARNWRLSGHVGMLVYLNSRSAYRKGDAHADWRVSVSRQFGNIEIHSALSGRISRRYSADAEDKATALTAGAAFNF